MQMQYVRLIVHFVTRRIIGPSPSCKYLNPRVPFLLFITQVFAYTGTEYNSTSFSSAPINGNQCAVQTLASIHDVSSDAISASISNVDGDSCHDVSIAFDPTTREREEVIKTKLKFGERISVPCTDFNDEHRHQNAEDGERRTAKLQFCSTYRVPADGFGSQTVTPDHSCDIVGPHPRSSNSCWCGTLDLDVEILDAEEVSTMTPSPYSGLVRDLR